MSLAIKKKHKWGLKMESCQIKTNYKLDKDKRDQLVNFYNNFNEEVNDAKVHFKCILIKTGNTYEIVMVTFLNDEESISFESYSRSTSFKKMLDNLFNEVKVKTRKTKMDFNRINEKVSYVNS